MLQLDSYTTPGRRRSGAAARPSAGQPDRAAAHLQHPQTRGRWPGCRLILLLRSTLQLEVQFDTSLQTPLMLTFFASIGLSADLASLKRGGKAVLTFLVVVTGLLLMQNSLGWVWPPCWSGIPTHGGCWPVPSRCPAATAPGPPGAPSSPRSTGAVRRRARHRLRHLRPGAGVIGGPVARHLVKKVQVPGEEHNRDDAPQGFEMPDMERPLTTFSVIETWRSSPSA